MGFADWAHEKLTLARALNDGECGGGYMDAAIIVSSVVSAIASDLWPGTGLDEKRFIELWARYAEPNAKRVSVPLFTRTLHRRGQLAEARSIKATYPAEMVWPGSTQVLVDDDVDRTEDELLSVCPTLSLRDLRKHSYPALFYKHIRCAGVHEYQASQEASSRAMTDREAAVSYVNELETSTMTTQRLIYFHFPWLCELVSGLVERVDRSAAPTQPTRWWIEG